MKKGIKNLAIAAMVGVASMGLMTGCKKEEEKPYIQVSGLDVAYIQNEDINLEGAKILYYSNKNDTTADEIKLTESMVANFDTDTTGEKKMKVLWNNFELEINYSVVSESDLVSLYNQAFNNFMNSEKVKFAIDASDDSYDANGSIYYSNNKVYANYLQNGENQQEWFQKEEDVWYVYLKSETVQSKAVVGEYENIKSRLSAYFLLPCYSQIDSNLINEKEMIFSYDIENSKKVIILTMKNGLDEFIDYKVTFDANNRFESWSAISDNNNSRVSCFYDFYDNEMIEVPTDVQWEDVE